MAIADSGLFTALVPTLQIGPVHRRRVPVNEALTCPFEQRLRLRNEKRRDSQLRLFATACGQIRSCSFKSSGEDFDRQSVGLGLQSEVQDSARFCDDADLQSYGTIAS